MQQKWCRKNCQKLLKTLTNRSYDKTVAISHINKAIAILRNGILHKTPTQDDENMPLIVNFNSTSQEPRHIVTVNILI